MLDSSSGMVHQHTVSTSRAIRSRSYLLSISQVSENSVSNTVDIRVKFHPYVTRKEKGREGT